MNTNYFVVLVLILGALTTHTSSSQGLYTARGYWEETVKPTYLTIKQKQIQADSLTADELTYLRDYEVYLQNYYSRLSDSEKDRYQRMKATWDQELATPRSEPAIAEQDDEFDLRARDRLTNGLYGLIYGASLDVIFETGDAAAAGIPLIMAGLWQLGPVMNPKKYENITSTTIRASNKGKFLGMIYGAGLGLAIGGSSDEAEKWAFGGLAVGSIALGELGFQLQKKKSLTAGHIETLGHYGVLGPWMGTAVFFSTGSDNPNVLGATLLAGGAAGLALGNNAYKRYPYTKGDIDAVSSLSLITTGIGLTTVISEIENGGEALILIPAAGTVIGTLIGQKQVRGVELTRKQGSTISLAAGGAALVGLGLSVLIESEEAWLVVGLPSAFALVTHQLVFKKFKQENLTTKLQGNLRINKSFHVGLKVNPENYFINKQIPVERFSTQEYTKLQNSVVKVTLKF